MRRWVSLFDASAFADTLAQVTADLANINAGVGWLAPCAYEQRAGGRGGASVVCEECGGSGTVRPGRARAGEACNECVVAVVGDAGEIVLRRRDLARQLEHLSRDAEELWSTTKKMTDRLARVAKLIDAAASGDERWGPITVEFREVEVSWAAKSRRVGRGEAAALPGVRKQAEERLRQFRRQQELVREAAAAKVREEREGRKVRNKWEGR